jgi:hypothetical protein
MARGVYLLLKASEVVARRQVRGRTKVSGGPALLIQSMRNSFSRSLISPVNWPKCRTA